MANGDALDELETAIISGDTDKAKNLTEKALKIGTAPYEIFQKGMSRAMTIVGEKFRNCEFFVSDLVLAGEAMKEALKVLEPILRSGGKQPSLGKIVIGSVEGDIHDLGKNIVIAMLSAAGFEIIDLGVDVPAAKFISETVKNKPDILAASAYISSTMGKLEEISHELKKRNLRNSVKYLVGGAVVTERYAQEIGADGYGEDAIGAVEIAKRLVEKNE